MKKIKIDEKEYDLSNPSEEVQAQLNNLQFVNDLFYKRIMSFKLRKLQVLDTLEL